MSFRYGLIALMLAGCSSSGDVTIGSADPGASASGARSGAPVPAAASAPGASASGSGGEPAPAWLGIPKPASEVLQVINKSGREPYAGKTATLKGRVTMKGDPAPATSLTFPADNKCPEAPAVYGKAFRIGQDNALADAVVMVAGYDAFVPPDKPAIQVKVSNCAFDSRTIAMTLGQRLEVLNTDAKTSYTPYLDGSDYRAVMIALPGGQPIKLYPHRQAIDFVLRDFQDRKFMTADVLVLKFPTHDVTGLDGRYEIGRIPVGKVGIDLYLPAIGKHVLKEIELKEGDNELDLEMTFDAAKDKLLAQRPDPWARGSDPNREQAQPGEFGAPPKDVTSAKPKEVQK